jgi:hypothetical protein
MRAGSKSISAAPGIASKSMTVAWLPVSFRYSVLVNRQQHVGRRSAIGDEDRPILGSLFGSAGVLIELAAG